MQVKTYTGESSAAVLAAVKADLGPEAVILDTRRMGGKGKGMVTMTAALDRAHPDAFSVTGGFSSASSPENSACSPVAWKAWHEEWSSIKGHLLALLKPDMKLDALAPRQRVAVEYLQREGVEDAVILDLYARLQAAPEATVLSALSALVPVRPWGSAGWPQKVHCICGPFGVGKTTVALRLALWLRKHHNVTRICLVNANVERGGGRLLLKNYAELSDMDYREAGNGKDMAAIMAEAASQGCERLIIDLPGLSRGMNLASLLNELGLDGQDAAMHLALSPHCDMAHYQHMIRRYIPGKTARRDASLIWTKLDEAERFGALVNVSAASRLPVSAVSFGAGLRNTLLPSDEASLWRLLFKRELPDGALLDGATPAA